MRLTFLASIRYHDRMKYALLFLLLAGPVYGQSCLDGSCGLIPLPSFQQNIRRMASPTRPPGEQVKYPTAECDIQGGMGFHVGDGLVVTCHHGEHSIVTYQGVDYPATYICGSPLSESDIAILKTDAPFTQQMRLADSPPSPGTRISWQGGSGRIIRYDSDTMYVGVKYRLGDSGGPVWGENGDVCSLVSAVCSDHSIGPRIEEIHKQVAIARKLIDVPPRQQVIVDQTQNVTVIVNQMIAAMKADKEFLAALQGPKGETGDTGPQGPVGPTGPPATIDRAELQSVIDEILADKGITVRTIDTNKQVLDSEFIPLGGTLNIIHKTR